MNETLSRDYCPSCGATDASVRCTTANGNDHKARVDWRAAWNSGHASAVAEARADERRWNDVHAERRRRELPALEARFEQWRRFTTMIGWGTGTPAFDRVKKALADVAEYRRCSNTRGWDYETEQVATLVLADTFAGQIQTAAGPDQDPATIAWIAAGLRCRRSPFCPGCPSCFTIASPNRPSGDGVVTATAQEPR